MICGRVQVDKACKLIEELLVVVDDDKNEHKQKQLRELALINGTLKEDEYCSVCAEKGHRCVRGGGGGGKIGRNPLHD